MSPIRIWLSGKTAWTLCVAMIVSLFLGFGWSKIPMAAGSGDRAPAKLDPTAKVETKIMVSQRRVRVTLTQFTDDLVWLHGMEPNEDGIFPPETLKKYYELHKDFLGQRLRILNVAGEALPHDLVDQGPYPFEDELLQQGATEFHLVKRKMSFTYEYVSAERDLDVITIEHSIVDDNFLYPAELSIDLFQGDSDLALTAKLRVETPMTAAFDWENPIPNLSASPEEIDRWLEAQSERMLGVTDFGSVYFWGYIEQRRLRVELLLPLNVLATLFEIESDDPAFLMGAELDAAAAKIEKYFQVGNPVSINGEVVAPQVQKIDFFPADQRDFAIQQKVEKLSFSNGRVGVTLSYPYRKLPTEIVAKWDRFSRAINSVEAYFFFEATVQRETFSRQLSDNSMLWKNPGELREPPPIETLPVQEADLLQAQRSSSVFWSIGAISLVAAVVAFGFAGKFGLTRNLGPAFAAGLGRTIVAACAFVAVLGLGLAIWPRPVPEVQPDRGDEIASGLLTKVYQAFDYIDETEIYQGLEQSVAGQQLRELYLQLLTGLRLEEQGGAVSTIQSVNVIESTPLGVEGDFDLPAILSSENTAAPEVAFRRRLRWNLIGMVEHWGHSHQRTNQYQAIATVAKVGDDWKIVQLLIESQTPGSSKPMPRKFQTKQQP